MTRAAWALALLGSGWLLVTWGLAEATWNRWVWPLSAGLACLAVGGCIVAWIASEAREKP